MGLWAEMGVMEEDHPEVGHQAVDVHQLEALEVAVGAPQLEDQAVDVHQLEVLEVEVDRQAEAGLEMVPEVQDALRCVQQFLTRFAVRMETPTAMSASLKLLRVTLLLQSLSSARANVAQVPWKTKQLVGRVE